MTFKNRVSLFLERIHAVTRGRCSGGWIREPHNRRYLSGFRAEDPQLLESAGSLVIGPEQSVLLTDSRFTLEAQSQAPDFRVRTYKSDFLKDFSETAASLNLKTLGFELNSLPLGIYRKARKRLLRMSPRVNLFPVQDAVEGMREIKDPWEMELLKTAAEKISTIMEELARQIRPGMTEEAVAWSLHGLAREAGTEGLSFPPIVASGPNGALPHAVPGGRTLREGEPIVVDAGVKVQGYCSDMTRTLFLGEPAPPFREVYGIVRRAQQNAIQTIQPGIGSAEVDAAARDWIEDAGFGEYFGHGLGHGVGLAVHEAPRVGPRKPSKLARGMVFTIEPGIYLPGKGGVRLEEMVALTDTGPVVLTRPTALYDV